MKSLLSHLSVWIDLFTFWTHGKYFSAVFSSRFYIGSFVTDTLAEASGEVKKIKPHDLIHRDQLLQVLGRMRSVTYIRGRSSFCSS